MNQAIQMQQQAYFAQMMQSQYMPYSQLPMQIVHYDVHPAGFFLFHMAGHISYESDSIESLFSYSQLHSRNAKRIPIMYVALKYKRKVLIFFD